MLQLPRRRQELLGVLGQCNTTRNSLNSSQQKANENEETTSIQRNQEAGPGTQNNSSLFKETLSLFEGTKGGKLGKELRKIMKLVDTDSQGKETKEEGFEEEETRTGKGKEEFFNAKTKNEETMRPFSKKKKNPDRRLREIKAKQSGMKSQSVSRPKINKREKESSQSKKEISFKSETNGKMPQKRKEAKSEMTDFSLKNEINSEVVIDASSEEEETPKKKNRRFENHESGPESVELSKWRSKQEIMGKSSEISRKPGVSSQESSKRRAKKPINSPALAKPDSPINKGNWATAESSKARTPQRNGVSLSQSKSKESFDEDFSSMVQMESRSLAKRPPVQLQDGSTYEGTWFGNKMEGIGVLVSPEGSIYSGQIKNSKKHGKGEMIWPSNNEYFVGEFKEDELHGYGLFRAPGVESEGFWVNSLLEGVGVTRQSDGVVYEGEFKGGKRNGKGKLVLQNQEVYEGEFKNDVPDGQVLRSEHSW